MSLVSLVSLMLLRLMLLVSHDGIMLHRLAHGAREEHRRGIGLSLWLLWRHLLPRGCGTLLPGHAQVAMDVARGGPGGPIGDVAVDLGLEQVLWVVVSLGRLLGRVGLRLVWRGIVRRRGLLVRLGRVRWREGRVASEVALREAEPVRIGARRPQGRHDGVGQVQCSHNRREGGRDEEASLVVSPS